MRNNIKTIIKTKLKRGDTVKVTTGKDKNKTGKILVIDRNKNRAIVEGVNMVKKHQKATKEHQQSTILSKENYIDTSNLVYIFNGKPTKLGYKLVTIEKDGVTKTVKQRFAKISGEVVD